MDEEVEQHHAFYFKVITHILSSNLHYLFEVSLHEICFYACSLVEV